jgi:predicted metalloprotease with PDZ domain
LRTLSAIIVTAALTTGSAHAAEAIRYTLSPVIERGKLSSLTVEMALTGESDGETELDLPTEWGGQSALWRGVSRFRVEGATRVVTDDNPARRIVQHPPSATLKVRYRLAQFWAGEPETTEFRPIIRPRYFHVIGWAALARPRWTLTTATAVTFKGLPATWRHASDAEHASSLKEALTSVMVGGDFRVLRQGPLTVAIRGAWAFSDEAFLKRLGPIIESHHRFWGDPPGAFLVTLLPIVSKPNSSTAGGTGLGDAFAFYATENVPQDRMLKGLAHEHMHSWIPLRVGSTPADSQGVAESWFSEGFTDFYTHRLLVRDGLSSVEDMAGTLNEIMWAYAFSPMRNAPNAQLVAEFWRDQAAHQMPYQRGFLIAALVDARLRQGSGGVRDLDDVMTAMKRATDAAGDARPPVRAHFIASTMSAGVDVGDDVRRFAEEGQTVVLPADVWAPCGVVETSEVAEFDRGFKGARTLENHGVVTGVDPDGPAHAAGLRDGMRILNLDLRGTRDSRVPLTYRVLIGSEVREITYSPTGKRRVSLQQLKLRPLDDGGRNACAGRLGGLN